ncbi:hypothetical protein SAMN02799636_01737 [Methylobacterium sp. 275MFSha3.1]|uniref:hypothetical protein n=1 Tax=Methylobacterium sp. 275MFSha3.1 TaxID=1502746 RepID=UPI0008A722EF|nr:hypothetical protein [Methylobacterium sp. 275MFSha3.1]SEH35292.1 hypothetical protein SAMN02799636_01737 [Methylobacterium sp. 275MFSha3.1]
MLFTHSQCQVWRDSSLVGAEPKKPARSAGAGFFVADRRNQLSTIRCSKMGQTGAVSVLGAMSLPGHSQKGLMRSGSDAMADLSDAVFVERWRLITGEPPAILLSSRTEMLALLVECTPAASLDLAVPAWDYSEANDRTSR